MLGNKTEYEINYANAYTNNTFSLSKTEKHIKRAMYNSFNYLTDLQKSYISIHRFNLTEKDLFTDYNNKIFFTIDKDFIDYNLRKVYRASDYYNKYVDIDTLCAHPEIFAYVHIVIIDGKTIFSYVVKSALDGTTTIQLPNIVHDKVTYVNTSHDIEVVFVKDLYMKSFTSNKYQLEDYYWKLPPSITGCKLKENQIIFMMFRVPGETEASNMFLGSVAADGYVRIDKNNPTVYAFVTEHDEFEVTVLALAHIHCAGLNRIIRQRSVIPEAKKSAFVIINPDVDNDDYAMPIPTHNLFILKVNKETGETTYENKRVVSLHYPNIYEIESDDVDETVYEYHVFYVYREILDYLKYPNKLELLHKFIVDKMDMEFEDAVETLLYSEIDDTILQNYFLNIYNYSDPIFKYDIDNFKRTDFPYDFDYKTNKMREFVTLDPWVLRDYGRDVAVPYTSFYLYTSDIDLTERVRMNTRNEAINPSDYIDFDEPHYVFAFRNETSSLLHIRFFIDGYFCPNPIQINSKFIDYFYIPCRLITDKSYLEIENHYDYVFKKKLEFTSTDEPLEVTFPNNGFVIPTLNDMYFTDRSGKKISRDNFKMYVMVDLGDFEVSDYINNMTVDTINIRLFEDLLIDDEGNYYIELLDPYYEDRPEPNLDGTIMLGDREVIDSSDIRLPFKYVLLNKMKIFYVGSGTYNMECYINIQKTSHLYVTQVTSNEAIRVKISGYNAAFTNKKQYFRMFINGNFVPTELNYHENNGQEYVVPNYYLDSGDYLTVDLTPFAYDKVCEIEEVPENFIVDLTDKIPLPFDFKYFDVYLNGRRLSDNNIEILSPVKIKLFNVHSRHNLYIFKRDRDLEFYGFEVYHPTLIDEFLLNEDIPYSYKMDYIDSVVYNKHGEVAPGDDTEPILNDEHMMDKDSLDMVNFYFDIIVPEYVARPNTFYMSGSKIQEKYPSVYNKYKQDGNRLVIQPNINHDAPYMIKVGKLSDGVIIND